MIFNDFYSYCDKKTSENSLEEELKCRYELS